PVAEGKPRPKRSLRPRETRSASSGTTRTRTAKCRDTAVPYRPRRPRTVRRPSRVSSCGAGWSTGFDSEEPRWNRNAVSTTYMPICKNSLSQFSKGRFIERPAEQIATKGNHLLPVLQLLGVVDPNAGQHHAAEEDHEERQIGDQQSLITQPFAHRAATPLPTL